MQDQAHFVEIDLLRGGPRLPVGHPLNCQYYAVVSQAHERPRAAIWPLGLRDRLPTIPIPLREPDAHIRLDLQQLLHHVYDAAGYERVIYQGAPQPPLGCEDAAWAD